MFTGCKAVSFFSVCCQNCLAIFGTEQQLGGVAGFYLRVRWQSCSGFVGQSLHQIAHACGSSVSCSMPFYVVSARYANSAMGSIARRSSKEWENCLRHRVGGYLCMRQL